ncbi:MAG: hypothetical protein QXT64_02500 [Desulfurococcaceae archaeon]
MDLAKVVAIICLTVICCVALMKDVDSALVATVAAIIGGIAGYSARKLAMAAGRKE